MRKIFIVLFLGIFNLSGCVTANKHPLSIETTPTDAFVSYHHTSDVSDNTRLTTGATPLEINLDFGGAGQLWLEIEKRGYAPSIVKVLPETRKISVDLEKIKQKNGDDIRDYAIPDIKRIILVKPDIKIFERKFSSENISEEKSIVAQEELSKGIEKYFSEKYEVVSVESSGLDEKLLRPLWRDVQSAMELLDPVRLKYVANTPLLETKSSQQAAHELGNKYGSEVILFITGKQNIETAGLKAGIAGTAIVGTATSYMSGYSRSLANNDSYFLYNTYAPSFSEGTLLGKIALVDCNNGEILLLKRGLLENIITDLLTSMNHN